MLGYFFYLTTELTLSPMKLNNAAAVSTGFLRPPNRAVLSAAAADLVGSFQEIKVCIHFISFIKSIILFYTMLHKDEMSAVSAAVVILRWKRLCLA